MGPADVRFNYTRIASLIEPGSTVLDLGCGDGELLDLLRRERNTKGRGVEIGEEEIRACIRKGISVFQGDLDEGLIEYSSGSYDYVILNETLQALKDPVQIIREMVRVGRRAIVNFPNFGYIVNRLQLLLRGRMPQNNELPYSWHDTPNIHFCTRRDFTALCNELGIRILETVDLRRSRRVAPWSANLTATECCFVLAGSETRRSV